MTRSTPTRPRERRLGRYELLLEVGHGGMAMVYAARAIGLGGFERLFAVKRVHDFLVRDAEFVAMFLEEARISAALHHAHVAQVFDVGEDEGRYFLAMEYLHGEPLSEVIRAASAHGGALPLALAAWVVARAAEGLHHAHEARDPSGRALALVHRDVSPHNIFVTYDGQVKLTDFGVAKALGRATKTESGAVKGKLAYASPEQLRLARDLDRRSDVFALGVVLWEATTGRRLFRAESDVETMRRIQEGYRVAPSSIVPGYPARLEAIVERALAHDRELRTPTAAELARELDAFVREAAPEGVAAATLESYLAEVVGDRRADKERALDEARAAGAAAPEEGAAPAPALLDATQTRVAGTPTPSAPEASAPEASTPVTAEAIVAPRRRAPTLVLSLAAVAAVAAAIFALRASRGGDPADLPTAAAAAPSAEAPIEPAAAVEETPPAPVAAVEESPPAPVAALEETPPPEPSPPEPAPPAAPARPRSARAARAAAAPASTPAAPEVEEPAGTGTLTLITRPWARVSVNGRDLGETPLISRRVPAGRVRVRLQREGEGEWRELVVDLAPGESIERYLDL